MTDQHPLTFQICKQIIGKELTEAMLHTTTRLYESGYDKGWDRGYERGYDKGMEDQLEQVIEWLKTNTANYVDEGEFDYYGTCFLMESFLDDFKKAMRPTQEDN